MKYVVALVALLAIAATAAAHNFGNPPTWNREISRLMYDRCASCHREAGTSFSLMTYQEVQPRSVAIKDAVLSRRMPPWGAVKGFGEFKDDRGLTQEQIELVTDWVENGTPRGNNSNIRPEAPKFDKPSAPGMPSGRVTSLVGPFTLPQAMTIAGLLPDRVPAGASMQIVAALPDGRVQPLLWLYEYQNRYRHPFLFREPVRLPARTVIRGVKPPARITLIEATSPPS